MFFALAELGVVLLRDSGMDCISGTSLVDCRYVYKRTICKKYKKVVSTDGSN